MCGFFKNFVRQGLGLAGKHLMNAANAATGGLAGKLVNGAIDGATKNAGVIGKVASQLGKRFLSDKTRNWLSKTADKALDYLPDGNVKTALSKINNAAQGRADDSKRISLKESPVENPSGDGRVTRRSRYRPTRGSQG